ncbi:MAG: thiosulfate oxidation carrier protein SoxY [Planctomycetota bacterium]|jgi:sulfur-oxidizing protein SoxY
MREKRSSNRPALEPDIEHYALTRRQVLAAGGGAACAIAALASWPGAALATPKDAKAVLAALTKGVPLEKGRVRITLPAITDRGPFTRLVVAVDSPMTADDYVEAIHIVAERNTVPEVASFHLGPHSGIAQVVTRIRLKQSQNIVAVAQMSDGTAHVGIARTKVLTGAGGCG